ncbi:TolC family outer membrane protein [Undibacterium amnicola]|uniref:TolC family outer membrane protein n=1 Tax=Undibacterium amnicola TaxID=1834038 RepID=A0ABR6XS06_9BURK|nr:TolC family outer membrane protein [Undibacterium amnicola]MBC3832216.1 TolC family outer membrane protein [Undibacterium amnicola]
MQSVFRKSLVSSACLILIGLSGSANAIGLIQAYQAALKNDPQHRAAIAENVSGQEFQVIGRSALLPQAQYSYSTANNMGESIAPDVLGRQKLTHLDYRSTTRNVTIRQTLFNLDAYARFKQGEAQTKLSDAQFDVRSKDLMVRVITAYADAKFAEDQLRLYQAQRDSYLEQKMVNDRLFQKGEGTKTDMLETQAKLDVAEAAVLEATDNLYNARNTLSGIIGMEVSQLDVLQDNFNVGALLQGDFEYWKVTAEKNNAEMLAAELELEIAEHDIAKSRAGHVPRVDLNANYNRGKSETVVTQTQDNNVRSIGVQLVIPIYSGGYVNAVSKQAVAQKDKARAGLDSTRIKVMNELRKQFNTVKSSVAKIEALQKSVASSTILVEATKQSIKGGVRINLDLLNAQQQLVTTQRDLAQARYSYLIGFIKLKATAGVANIDDLHTLSGFFAPN